MADVFTKAKRSAVMARIRSRGNRETEIALARVLRRNGITGWRRQREIRSPKSEARRFRVRPDFVFPRRRLAVFVDGCFWHGCPKHATWPVARSAWWRRKILGNQRRDALVTRSLRRLDWQVLRIWEHELAAKNQARLLQRIRRALACGRAGAVTGGHPPRPNRQVRRRSTRWPAARRPRELVTKRGPVAPDGNDSARRRWSGPQRPPAHPAWPRRFRPAGGPGRARFR